MSDKIELVDLQTQRQRLGTRIDKAIAKVLEHGAYIMGPEVEALERELVASCGARRAVTCASGTDALVLALRALDVGPGDGVFVPSLTFSATAEAVVIVGATPIFVDVSEASFTMNPDSLVAAISSSAALGCRPVGSIAVDLYGHPADYSELCEVSAVSDLWILADAAQSFGATLNGRRSGAIVDVTATSFFPAKPLGCYGDGGAVLTHDDALADLVESLRQHGQGADKYENVRVGMNSRLDSIQAAILLEKLSIFEDELAARQDVARHYADLLDGVVGLPSVAAGATSAWASYTVLVEDREAVMARLEADGIASRVYYPTPLHRQRAYQSLPAAPGGLPVTEELSARILSLPMHPYLDAGAQARIAESLQKATGGRR